MKSKLMTMVGVVALAAMAFTGGKPCTCCTDHAKCACGKTGCNCKK